MALSPEDIERRIRAKRFNERVKLAANATNAVGLTLLAAAALVPFVGGLATWSSAGWIPVALGLHFMAQFMLGRLKSED